MPALRKGARVLAQFGGDGGDWYAGKIASEIRKDGTFCVEYDDGDVDKRLRSRHVQLIGSSSAGSPSADDTPLASTRSAPTCDSFPEAAELFFTKGMRVEAQFGGEGGDWFPGHIGSKQRKDGTYRVNYDDGDVDLRLLPKHIRSLENAAKGRDSVFQEKQGGKPLKTEEPTFVKPTKRPAPDNQNPRDPSVLSSSLPFSTSHETPSHSEAGVSSTPASSGMSSYERERLRKISQNHAMLKELGLHDTSASAIPTATRGQSMGAVARHARALGIKRTKREPRAKLQPSRRSLRVQGKGADGKELPASFKEPSAKGGYGALYHGSNDRAPEMSISGNVEVDEDGQLFLQSLRLRAAAAAKLDGGSKDDEDEEEEEDVMLPVPADILKYAERLAALQVDEEEGLRRVTPQRIYSLAFSPSRSDLVVAAGDKVGNFGMWACGAKFGSDGVFTARPHSATLSGVLFNPVDDSKIFTCSYDGRVMELDTTKVTFSEIHTNQGAAGLFDIQCDPSCSSLYVAREDGGLTRFDRRCSGAGSSKGCETWDLHEKKINTVSLRHDSTQPTYLSTASLDRTVAIWDLRNMSKPLHLMPHGLSVNQSGFSPDGSWLCTVAQDNLLRSYDANALIAQGSEAASKSRCPPQPSRKCRHDNRTGRWLTKFKLNWDPKQPNAFVIGSMDQPRCIEVFSSDCSRIMRMRTEAVRSVQSLNVFHAHQDAVVSANSSGKVHLWVPPA
eukprot:INCI16604.1.p1 GENE.INCI16604.1~~INCI16604.1.p1  ORF type:complete len:765 (-),score=91.84 INCI16604.1:13-2199(-)